MRLNIKVKREPNFPVNLARIKTLTCFASLAEQGSTAWIIKLIVKHMPGAVVICKDTKF